MSRSFWPSTICQCLARLINAVCEKKMLRHTASPSKESFQAGNEPYSNCAHRESAPKLPLAQSPLPWSVPLHSNPSCSLKNSLNARSSLKALSSFGVWAVLSVFIIDLRRSAAVGFDDRHRHSCARSPSNCFRPFLILLASEQERESNDSERSDSIAGTRDSTVETTLLVRVAVADLVMIPARIRGRVGGAKSKQSSQCRHSPLSPASQ